MLGVKFTVHIMTLNVDVENFVKLAFGVRLGIRQIMQSKYAE